MRDRTLSRAARGTGRPSIQEEWCGLCRMTFPSAVDDDDDDPRYAPVASQCREDLAHVFHQWCIAEWTADGNHTCPTCNVDPQLVIKRRAVAERVRARQALESTSLRFAHARAARRCKRQCLEPLFRWAWTEAPTLRRIAVVMCLLIALSWAALRVASALKMESLVRTWRPIKVYDALEGVKNLDSRA